MRKSYHHYRRQRRRLGPAAARLATITHVGPAIVLTGAILFSGYAFMTLGSLQTVRLFGLLTAISIVGAMFGELIIFPLLLARFDREVVQAVARTFQFVRERSEQAGPDNPAASCSRCSRTNWKVRATA